MRLKAWLERRLTRQWWEHEPSALFVLLTYPLSIVYFLLWVLHLWRRRVGPPLPVPVVVVGNFIVGGAGKTPTVMAVVQALQAAGWRPGVVSRGHGRRGQAPLAVEPDSPVAEVGDEPLLIRRRGAVPVFVGRARREAGAALLQAHPEVDVLVSDDGLQHAALPRHVEVLVFDERGAGNGFLLPVGPLREPLPAQPNAGQLVLYTHGAPSTHLPGHLAQRRIFEAWPLAAWHQGDATQAVPLAQLQGRACVAAAGMGMPQKFFDMLAQAGLRITALPLPDHHPFHQLPWDASATDVLVTEKDAVKLDPARMGSTRVWVVPLDLALPEGLVTALLSLLPPTPPRTPP